MVYFLIWIGLSFLVGKIGENKNIGFWGSFFVAILLSPLIGLIVALVSSDKKKTPEETLPHKVIITEAEKAEFKGDQTKAIDLYLDALYTVKKYQFKTEGHQHQQVAKIAELEEKIISLGGKLPYPKAPASDF
jgi:hypothetical protein